MNLDDAIVKHAEWKLKFRTAIGANATMDVATISKDNCCELGKWLYGEGKTKFGVFPETGDCITKHAIFHQEAGKVAAVINAKRHADAEAMLDSGTPYTVASKDVGVAIMRLKKKASL